MTMTTTNPALGSDTFLSQRTSIERSDMMTIQGTVYKTALLLLVCLLSAGWTWKQFYLSGGNGAAMTPWLTIGALGGFVVALVTVFKKTWAPVTAPLYALLEGLFIGALSAQLELAFPGIVIQAAGLTFGTLFAMLLAYQSGMIKATEKFKFGVVAATGGIALVYLAVFVLSFFGIHPAFFYSSSWLSIGISLFVVVIAALNFILDFDFIEQGAKQGAPKYMEWYSGFALMVTLVWLYIEFLRLLSKLRNR
ncbi:MAG: Bax inhibitor-1/YccA family protein [Parachlamydiaceae bacterium]